MEKDRLPPREGTAQNGALEAWRQRRSDRKPGQWEWDDHWPDQIPVRWLRCCAGLALRNTFGP